MDPATHLYTLFLKNLNRFVVAPRLYTGGRGVDFDPNVKHGVKFENYIILVVWCNIIDICFVSVDRRQHSRGSNTIYTMHLFIYYAYLFILLLLCIIIIIISMHYIMPTIHIYTLSQ